MLKQTSTPYTGQLLALCMSGWSVQCVGRPWNMTLITPVSLFSEADSTGHDLLPMTRVTRVVRNIFLFERELS